MYERVNNRMKITLYKCSDNERVRTLFLFLVSRYLLVIRGMQAKHTLVFQNSI